MRISLLIANILFLIVLFSPFPEGLSRGSKAHAAGDDIFKKVGIKKLGEFHRAPDFTLKDVDGNSVSLGDFRGKTVFLNFWATWCTPCRWEMPSMERLYRQLGGRGLVMLAVDSKESRKQVANFMNEFQLSFPALLDTNGSVSSLYRVVGFPSTHIIDRRGRMIGMKVGPKDWAARDSVEFFNKLLEAKEGSESYIAEAVPTILIPLKVFAKSSGAVVRAGQDPQSQVVAKLEKGDELATLGNSSGAGEDWYMVKTAKGLIGWVKAAEVEQPTRNLQ